MLLSQFKINFIDKLKGEYSETEISSFFYILVEEFLGMTRLKLALNPNFELNKSQRKLFEQALERLLHHEPVQYIIGKKEFYGRSFKVNQNVLIPRPETEELVEWIITDTKELKDEVKILDIGTGSGCIAISLAKELPEANVSAFDISNDALKVAKENAKNNNASVIYKQLDILKTENLESKFDIIVSNPPYVRILEKKRMQKNVLNHEPETALYVEDNDALIFYKKITSLAASSLVEGGKLYFEINQYLAESTKSLVEEFGFEAELKKDIFGNYRMLKATKSKR